MKTLAIHWSTGRLLSWLVKGGRVSIFAGATPTLVTAVVKALR
ncbi:hypothetical protein [Mesorhizobium sp. M0698]